MTSTRRRSDSSAGLIILGLILILFYLALVIYTGVQFWENFQDGDTHDMTFYGIVLVILVGNVGSRR